MLEEATPLGRVILGVKGDASAANTPDRGVTPDDLEPKLSPGWLKSLTVYPRTREKSRIVGEV